MNHDPNDDLHQFLKKIEKLLEEMESWCTSAKLAFNRSTISISEEAYGTYKTEQLTISTLSGAHIADVIPVGASILGANGRVDIKGPYDQIILVDLNVGGPSITTTITVGDQKQTHSRHFYKGIDEPGWYWIESQMNSRGHKLDRELFLNLLAEVSDYERN